MAEFLTFKSENAKIKARASKLLLAVAVVYFVFILLIVLSLFDIYFSCSAFDLRYHFGFCQRMMGCTEKGENIVYVRNTTYSRK